ncbi:hypothetical protein F5J12DRAFT_936881 [Pisolithus orientalis]|uniref:uncharacterized protein n=1 Tax=Pisolithus orientalis TaxID=936130 RepID=UPI0022257F2C|nr:uncharacterized protein F5J12DRAFT_936881 [Pisolithus orientalis]KAI6008198.1 hypothetical protein F5J12DRAFT_936881 [Pisolithus orientalis]
MSQKDGSGIQAWTTSIRVAMANDPCRQLFEDQIQVHAFLFLEDYFESIISGPQQAPIIDLVKTPSRKKKNIPRNTRTVTADPISLLEFQPITSDDRSQNSSLPLPSQGRTNELSVIAEDDESPERSHVHTMPPPTASPGHRHLETGTPVVPKDSLTDSGIQPPDVVDVGSGAEELLTSATDSKTTVTPIKTSHHVSLVSSHPPHPSNTFIGDDAPSSPQPSHTASIVPHDASSLVPSSLLSNLSPEPMTVLLDKPESANSAHTSGGSHYPDSARSVAAA